MYDKITKEIKNLSEPKFAEWFKPFIRFDEHSKEIVLGVRVPKLRALAKKYKNADVKIIEKLLQNDCHEFRQIALFIMVLRSKKEPDAMCKLYIDNLVWINNWDLVDTSAPHVVAPNVSKQKLRELADSDYLWANRVAMVSTIYYIKQNDFSLALEFAKKFMTHKSHFMHKASGWMLREVGKKDEKVLRDFLQKYSAKMPSVMRSYATERLKLK